ncbi:MAG: FAD:protein FMN transferase [Paracoccaceae bacterium]
MTYLSRRRFLTMSAACAAIPAYAVTPAQWRGVALGANARLRLDGLSEAEAAPVIAAVEAELARLEDIFSLYRPSSELCRLNRDGYLPAPAPELLHVLSLCSTLHNASGGAFDPTVQPLWHALAAGADAVKVAAARDTIGWSQVAFSADAIRLPYPGRSALTLNGIAQGAVTDRIADLLRSFDLRHVLVDMGEITAIGPRADGRNWRVGLAGPEGAVLKRIAVRDRAVATSAPDSILLTAGQGHILNPTGSRPHHQLISVSASTAALADGLSTALCNVAPDKLPALLAQFPGAALEMQR